MLSWDSWLWIHPKVTVLGSGCSQNIGPVPGASKYPQRKDCSSHSYLAALSHILHLKPGLEASAEASKGDSGAELGVWRRGLPPTSPPHSLSPHFILHLHWQATPFRKPPPSWRKFSPLWIDTAVALSPKQKPQPTVFQLVEAVSPLNWGSLRQELDLSHLEAGQALAGGSNSIKPSWIDLWQAA